MPSEQPRGHAQTLISHSGKKDGDASIGTQLRSHSHTYTHTHTRARTGGVVYKAKEFIFHGDATDAIKSGGVSAETITFCVCVFLSTTLSAFTFNSSVLPLVQSDFHVLTKALLAQRSGNPNPKSEQ